MQNHLRLTAGLCAVVFFLALLFASPPEFERGKYNGMGYACRYAADMVDGRLIIDKSYCVGRLENGLRFEKENGVITIGE